MESIGTLERARLESWTDQEIVDRVLNGDTALYEIIMRRYNQRLYRVTYAILRDASEAEDVIQDAYVRAWQHLDQFAGYAPFSTWLTRIAVHEALRRLRLRKRSQQFDYTEPDEEAFMDDRETSVPETSLDPEQRASVGQLLEQAVLDLPEQYRAVIMLRDVEELTTAETAAALDLTEENVKVLPPSWTRHDARPPLRTRRRQRKKCISPHGPSLRPRRPRCLRASARIKSGTLSLEIKKAEPSPPGTRRHHSGG
jgi:RNA polymerase sigma-70 factor, ECF subfamily